MIPLLIAVLWMLAFLLIVALCMSARIGDLAQSERSRLASSWPKAESRAWEPAMGQPISVRATIEAPRASRSERSPAGTEIAA